MLVDSAERVLSLSCRPIDQFIGVAGLHDDGVLEVRAFYPVRGTMVEDPVCGSLNAAFARWLPSRGVLDLPYDARQGQVLGRSGRLRITGDGKDIWIGGSTRTLITGTLHTDGELPGAR